MATKKSTRGTRTRSTTGATGVGTAPASSLQSGLSSVQVASVFQSRTTGGLDVMATGPFPVQLQPSGGATADERFWDYIKSSSELMKFGPFDDFLNFVLCGAGTKTGTCTDDLQQQASELRAGGLHSVHAYQLLKTAAECYLMQVCGTVGSKVIDELPNSADLLATHDELLKALETDLKGQKSISPWINQIVSGLGEVARSSETGLGNACNGLLQSRLQRPCLIEFIWSYWMEESLFIQLMNAIGMRFQNRRARGAIDPLAGLTLSPLRPLNNLLFGYLQDEPHRLTVLRRAYEYDHHYGLTLHGKAVPEPSGADSRSRFIAGFHTLLNRCWEFFLRLDDMTIQADGFPVLSALREVHLLLAEGADNQYGDLPWTARVEMMIQQWLLGREEMREFLSSRPMMPYAEPWMGRVDTYKRMLNIPDVSTTHYYELAFYGERLLLSIRHGDWTSTSMNADHAVAWARAWRQDIQFYIHAYRAVSGVDLTKSPVDTRSPSTLLRRAAARLT